MTKSELVSEIAKGADLHNKQAEAALNAFTASVTKAIADGDKVQLIGFGTFDVKERAARTGRNPRTGEAVNIAACKVPSFKAGNALKEAVNQLVGDLEHSSFGGVVANITIRGEKITAQRRIRIELMDS